MEDYSEIKALSSTNEERIRAAKTKIEILKGDNHHQTQCKNIPEIITEYHGIHMSPCYKKFTQILSKSHDDEDFSGVARSSRRNSNDSSSTMVYPDVCGICKKGPTKNKGKKVFLTTIVTKKASDTIKEAAKSKDRELYAEIKELDLIAKEFKYHRHCWKNFTRKRKHDDDTFEVSFKLILLYILKHITFLLKILTKSRKFV